MLVLFQFSVEASPSSQPLTAGYTKTNVSVCGGGSDGTITIIATGGTGNYTYSWTASNGFTANTTNPILLGLRIGFYHVVITDDAMQSVSINNIHIANAFAVYITSSSSASGTCNNSGSVILYGNAGVLPYSYSINGTNYQPGNTFNNLAAGTYTAYIKDAGGCVSSKSVQVGTAPEMTASAYVSPAGYCSDDGKIQLFRTGGVSPYTYSINGYSYQLGNSFAGLPAGTYTGWVKDSRGCTAMLPGLVITKNNEITVSVIKKNTSSCYNDGSLQYNPSGGYPPYTYSLNGTNYQVANTFTGLGTGHYYGSVKDSRGCVVQKTATISLNPILVSANVNNVTNCVVYDGRIQLSQTGGTGGFTYSLDGDNYQVSNTFNELEPGTYFAFVKDSMICIGTLGSIEVYDNCVSRPLSGQSKNPSVEKAAKTANGLEVQVWPNISTTDFQVLLQTSRREKIKLTVMNDIGVKIYETEISAQKKISIGDKFIPGIYFLKVTQGSEKQTIRIIKTRSGR